MNDYLHLNKTDFHIVCMQRLSQVHSFYNQAFLLKSPGSVHSRLGMWKYFLLRVAICQTLMLKLAAAVAWPRDTYGKYKSWFSNDKSLQAV